jgi:hypothetical protein
MKLYGFACLVHGITATDSVMSLPGYVGIFAKLMISILEGFCSFTAIFTVININGMSCSSCSFAHIANFLLKLSKLGISNREANASVTSASTIAMTHLSSITSTAKTTTASFALSVLSGPKPLCSLWESGHSRLWVNHCQRDYLPHHPSFLDIHA